MKITAEHRQYIKEAIDIVLSNNPDCVSLYETGNFSRSESVKDLQTRFNFDLLYAAKIGKWLGDVIYPYANDSHISTALRGICPAISRKY